MFSCQRCDELAANRSRCGRSDCEIGRGEVTEIGTGLDEPT